MSALVINLNPDKKTLRQFGFLMASVFAVLFGLILPWVFGKDIPRWPWYFACGFALPALIFPPSLKYIYILWMKFGMVMGAINSRIILGLFFYLMLTPIGLVMRLLGNDPMRRKISDDQVTYRIKKSETISSQDMTKPF